ncbi:MAG TPA: TadE family protein [Candidatus Binatia bacterium]|nr:TadE family protein [Candidatus Binatia bacterium]
MYANRSQLPMYDYYRAEEPPRTSRLALAVVVPLVSAFLFGLIEIGSAFFTQYIVRSAAIEGVRYAIAESTAKPDTEQVIDYVRRYMSEGGLAAGDASVVVTGAGGSKGDKLIVDVAYPASLLVMTLLVDWTPAVEMAVADTGEPAPAQRKGRIILHGKAVGVFE